MPVPPDKPEFSRIVPLEHIGTGWMTERLQASDAERAALAVRFELAELSGLTAEVRLRRARAGRYVEIDATLRAAVAQSCVVTLDPVAAEIEESFTLLMGPIDERGRKGDELVVELDEPEPLDGDEIDVGELVAQQLSLALDPYPRRPDVAFPDGADPASRPADDAAPAAPAANPFAALLARQKPK
jgi:uncharacterized metal-binding protein YceD (DUF177 family)